jgi:hypothetical protein
MENKEQKSKFETYNRKAIMGNLKGWCIFSTENDYIEVCKWENGEGFDIEISNKASHQRFQLTYGEFDLIKKLVKKIDH